jgi:DNA-binding winged helix-turn-helix (wHTH) protein
VSQKHFYEFGPYRIDVALSRLERAGDVISVPPKAFDLLLLLARNPDRLLSKNELMEALWPKTFVEDANLTQHVYTLRKALGDRPDGEPYIETVPRRGYRLNAAVREAHVDRIAPPPQPPAAVGSPREQHVAPVVVIEGERKQATVLHCGVANAAGLAERLGPTGFHDAMTRLADIAAEEIGRYDGILRQGHADQFVALFGARTVHEDDARRAVIAAIAIERRRREAVPSDTPGEEQPLVRIGINSGAVVVSRRADVRGVEYSAVGETMRTADLLFQLAEPGIILISEATRRAVEGYVEVVRTPIEAAGMPAFRVLRPVSADQARPPRFTRTLTPFVGRVHELALLGDLAAQARNNKGQVVSIVGEPGMGKSRLMHEFAQGLPAGGVVTVLEGKCVSYGSLVPYLPLVDVIRMQCGVSEGDSPERSREALDPTVREANLPADAAAWLLRLIGIVDTGSVRDTLSPEAIKARTFDVLRTLLLRASTRTPLVILVEDVHWIDRTSEEFLTTFIERLGAARVMLVATYRPGYRAPWIDRSYVTQVTLTPLTAGDSSRLVDSVTRDQPIPESVSTAILAKGEGNPFFLEELARTVVDGGPEEQGIPDTVHGVIMARLDRLPDSAKQLLQTASVLGREVPLRLLTRMRRTTDVGAELVDLCRQEFLYERPGSDEPVFAFKHGRAAQKVDQTPLGK